MLRNLSYVLLVVEGQSKDFGSRRSQDPGLPISKDYLFKSFCSCVTTLFPTISNEGILLLLQGQDGAYKVGVLVDEAQV